MNEKETFLEKYERSVDSKVRGECNCWKCMEERNEIRTHMILCPVCGNKRCPKASDHNLECTGSNEPGQPGSVYGGIDVSNKQT